MENCGLRIHLFVLIFLLCRLLVVGSVSKCLPSLLFTYRLLVVGPVLKWLPLLLLLLLLLFWDPFFPY